MRARCALSAAGHPRCVFQRLNVFVGVQLGSKRRLESRVAGEKPP